MSQSASPLVNKMKKLIGIKKLNLVNTPVCNITIWLTLKYTRENWASEPLELYLNL